MRISRKKRGLNIKLNGRLPKGDLSLTGFARKVYRTVLSIPIGEVCSYKWLAEKIGCPGAYHAVGQVLKNNPYPLIIPCHRVIKSDGSLGGYAWGVKAKKRILDLERQIKKLMI